MDCQVTYFAFFYNLIFDINTYPLYIQKTTKEKIKAIIFNGNAKDGINLNDYYHPSGLNDHNFISSSPTWKA